MKPGTDDPFDLQVDTTGIADGDRQLQVALVDAAGNEQREPIQRIHVGNQPATPPTNPVPVPLPLQPAPNPILQPTPVIQTPPARAVKPAASKPGGRQKPKAAKGKGAAVKSKSPGGGVAGRENCVVAAREILAERDGAVYAQKSPVQHQSYRTRTGGTRHCSRKRPAATEPHRDGTTRRIQYRRSSREHPRPTGSPSEPPRGAVSRRHRPARTTLEGTRWNRRVSQPRRHRHPKHRARPGIPRWKTRSRARHKRSICVRSRGPHCTTVLPAGPYRRSSRTNPHQHRETHHGRAGAERRSSILRRRTTTAMGTSSAARPATTNTSTPRTTASSRRASTTSSPGATNQYSSQQTRTPLPTQNQTRETSTASPTENPCETNRQPATDQSDQPAT